MPVQSYKADSVIVNSATGHGFTILDKQNANPSGSGTGDIKAPNKQEMFKIKLANRDGVKKSALVKIANEITGTLSDEIEVI